MVPVIEIAHNDTVARDVQRLQEKLINQPRLRAPFAHRSAQMYIENVQEFLADPDTRAQSSARLAALDA